MQAALYKTDQPEAIYPEYYLIKIKNFDDVAKDTLDQWIYFLKNEEVKDDFKAKGLDKAKEVLDYMKCSKQERQAYEAYKESLHYEASMYESTYVAARIEGKMEGREEGREEGEQIGIAKGEIIGKIKTLQENIMQILCLRFQVLPKQMQTGIMQVQEIDALNHLLIQAMIANSLEEFENALASK